MKKFVGKLQTKTVPFMDDEIAIRKLTAGAVRRIGDATKDVSGDDNALDSLVVIFNEAVVLEEGEDKITSELLEEFPLDELNTLATEIMSFAGVSAPEGN